MKMSLWSEPFSACNEKELSLQIEELPNWSNPWFGSKRHLKCDLLYHKPTMLSKIYDTIWNHSDPVNSMDK